MRWVLATIVSVEKQYVLHLTFRGPCSVIYSYEGGPKNNDNFLLDGRGAVLPSAPAWCVFVTALRIS